MRVKLNDDTIRTFTLKEHLKAIDLAFDAGMTCKVPIEKRTAMLKHIKLNSTIWYNMQNSDKAKPVKKKK